MSDVVALIPTTPEHLKRFFVFVHKNILAGLAKTGFRPFFAVYSTFLQRAFDQAFQEVSLQGLAVRLCLDRAGLVGGDGAVHHGFCDISLLRTLPNAALLAPIDEPSLKAAVAWMANYDDGLSAVRYPRGTVTERDLGPCPPFELGRSRPLHTPEQPVAAIVHAMICEYASKIPGLWSPPAEQSRAS